MSPAAAAAQESALAEMERLVIAARKGTDSARTAATPSSPANKASSGDILPAWSAWRPARGSSGGEIHHDKSSQPGLSGQHLLAAQRLRGRNRSTFQLRGGGEIGYQYFQNIQWRT